MAEHVTAAVQDLSTDGRGVARVEDRACFIAGTYPGDLVRIELEPDAEPAAGRVLEYLALSPHRVSHPCPHADDCPASPWGRLAYERQLEARQRLVSRTLRKALGEADVLPAVASPRSWHYRSRITVTVWKDGGRLCAGYRTQPREDAGAALTTCKLAVEPVDELLHALVAHLAKLDVTEDLLMKRIQLFETVSGAGMMLIFGRYPAREIIRFWTKALEPLRVSGGMWIAQGSRAGIVGQGMRVTRVENAEPMAAVWMGRPLQIHPAAFTQANSGAAELVHARLRRLGQENRFSSVWDLYGGYGGLGLALAGSVQPVTVMEISSYAERTFADLASAAGNDQSRFVRGDLLLTLPTAAKSIAKDDVVVLDPPRSGAHPEVLAAVGKSRCKCVAYLSCNAARLARDLRLLREHGFVAIEVQPYDFFPQTPATETLAILQR